MSPPLRAALVDMGGVLLEMGNAAGLPRDALDYRGREALLHRLRDEGARLDFEDLKAWLFEPWRREYEQRYQRGREASWGPHLDRLRAEADVDFDDETLLGAWFRPYGESLQPTPGALEALEDLGALGLELSLISNVPLPGFLYRDRLEAFGLSFPFRALRFSYDTGSRKPSPAMLNAALTELEIAPPAALMVGDRRASDVAAGRAAGTRTVWIESRDGGGPQPDLTVASLADLPVAIQAWL